MHYIKITVREQLFYHDAEMFVVFSFQNHRFLPDDVEYSCHPLLHVVAAFQGMDIVVSNDRHNKPCGEVYEYPFGTLVVVCLVSECVTEDTAPIISGHVFWLPHHGI